MSESFEWTSSLMFKNKELCQQVRKRHNNNKCITLLSLHRSFCFLLLMWSMCCCPGFCVHEFSFLFVRRVSWVFNSKIMTVAWNEKHKFRREQSFVFFLLECKEVKWIQRSIPVCYFSDNILHEKKQAEKYQMM